MEVATAIDNSGSAKRRKVGSGELRLNSSKSVRITGGDGEDVINTSKDLSDSVEKEELTSGCSGDIPASCCSSNGSIMEKQKQKCADLEESAGSNNLDRRESFHLQIKTHILSPNLIAGYITKSESEPDQSLNTEKQPVQIDSRRTITPEKTPPTAEIEEFFASAEKDLQNRFKNKYNYDIVNDVPLKGRFEWTPLKP